MREILNAFMNLVLPDPDSRDNDEEHQFLLKELILFYAFIFIGMMILM